ncbi:hypothetical protein FKM82_021025 [Ascaphus truei]
MAKSHLACDPSPHYTIKSDPHCHFICFVFLLEAIERAPEPDNTCELHLSTLTFQQYDEGPGEVGKLVTCQGNPMKDPERLGSL